MITIDYVDCGSLMAQDCNITPSFKMRIVIQTVISNFKVSHVTLGLERRRFGCVKTTDTPKFGD